jgi:hypothetical protein
MKSIKRDELDTLFEFSPFEDQFRAQHCLLCGQHYRYGERRRGDEATVGRPSVTQELDVRSVTDADTRAFFSPYFNGTKLLGRTLRCDYGDQYRFQKEVQERESLVVVVDSL